MSREPELRWTVPDNWAWTSLSKIGEIVAGGTPSTKEPTYWGNEINWISPADLTGYLAKTIKNGAKSISRIGLANSSAKVMPAGSVHFSSRAPIGYVAISSEQLATNQGFKSLVPAPGILNEFVYYYLMASREYARKRASGTTFFELSGRAFSSLPIPLAPTVMQHRIVAKIEKLFSELDKGVESLKTARAQLDVYRQAVLKHAFEGKLTARWREENKDKLEKPEQLLARIKQEREARYERQLQEWRAAVKEWEAKGKRGNKPTKPQKLNELKALTSDELPTLPEGWFWLQFGDLCSLIRNGISKKPEGDCGEKIFRISAVRPMEFDLDDVRFIADDSGEFANYYLQHGDLVFTRYNGSRPYVGVCAEYKSDGSHLYPDKLIRTQLGTSQTLPGYIEKAINCGASRHFIETRIRTTAGQSGISGSDIKSMPIPLCNSAEQIIIKDRIDEELSRVSLLWADIEENLDLVEALRQSILKKAFSGQLVTQAPHDEPASVLLDRIKAERDKNVKSKTQKKKNKRKTAA